MKTQNSTIISLNLFCISLSFLLMSTIFCTTIKAQVTRKDYALFIAIKDYEHWPVLKNPISDAQFVARELETEYGFGTEIIRNAKKIEILKVLRKYREKKYNSADQLFIFFSGHGEYSEESWQGFFIPQDASKNDEFHQSYIAFSSLEREISSIPSQHILLAIDACYSGTFDKDLAVLKSSEFGIRPGENDEVKRNKFVARLLKHKSRLYITSGGKERTPDGIRYSPFTEGLLTTLRTYGGNDEILTFAEVVSGMETVNPTPYSGEFAGNEPGGSFIFDSNTSSHSNLSFQEIKVKKPNNEISIQAEDRTAVNVYNEGLTLLKQKDYEGGLVLMEQALEKAGPEDEKVTSIAKKNGAIAAYNAGNAQRKSGGLDEAMSLYNKGIALNPSNSSNYEGVARTHEAKGDKVGAVTAYLTAAQKGIEEDKADRAANRSKKAQTIVGKLFVAKDYQTAIAAGKAFLAMKPDVPEVHYYLSRAFAESDRAEKALEHAKQAVTLAGDTHHDKYFYAQATQYEKLGKKHEAIAAYRKITGEIYGKQAAYRIKELGG